MGQLEDYWVSKAVFDEELKRRQDAEKRLDEVLRPRLVTVQVEEGQDGMTIERILVKAGAAQRLEEAHDLIGSRVVRIEECHVVDSHWRGEDQEFNLYVGDSFACRVKLVTPETKAERGNV